MPRITSLIAGLMLITPTVLSIPFYVQEECFCQPTTPKAQRDLASLAQCQRIARQIQTNRAALSRIPHSVGTWATDIDITNVSSRGHVSTQAHADSRHLLESTPQPARKAASRHTSDVPAKPCDSQLRPRSAQSQSLKEQRDSRHYPGPLSRSQHEAEYNIMCQPRVYTTRTRQVIYITFKPIPIMFVVLAMVLAWMTIIEWVLVTWSRYATRIQLDGPEKLIYALPGQGLPCEEKVDDEKQDKTTKR